MRSQPMSTFNNKSTVAHKWGQTDADRRRQRNTEDVHDYDIQQNSKGNSIKIHFRFGSRGSALSVWVCIAVDKLENVGMNGAVIWEEKRITDMSRVYNIV